MFNSPFIERGPFGSPGLDMPCRHKDQFLVGFELPTPKYSKLWVMYKIWVGFIEFWTLHGQIKYECFQFKICYYSLKAKFCWKNQTNWFSPKGPKIWWSHSKSCKWPIFYHIFGLVTQNPWKNYSRVHTASLNRERGGKVGWEWTSVKEGLIQFGYSGIEECLAVKTFLANGKCDNIWKI